jgi:hypothetical protein
MTLQQDLKDLLTFQTVKDLPVNSSPTDKATTFRNISSNVQCKKH